ncbi:sensor histidine kinase [Novosphingobium sp.]|uniref:sensor histidine kinase n=1 Tax=Novosphingobium sp. TaxID=1874826 RepID=UPI00286E5F5A|nr:sensor histidine kinase [Novosphingobium sp.]
MTGRPAGISALYARWNWDSLRLRVMLAIFIWVALGIGGIGLSATRLFAKHVEEQYHEELSVHVKELAGLVQSGKDGSLSLNRPLSDPRYLIPLSGFYWQVSVEGGATLRSPSMTRGKLEEKVAHSPDIVHLVEKGPTGPTITYGFAQRQPGGKEIHYLIATDQRLLDNVIQSFTSELLAWLAALAVSLLITGLAIVTFGFQPMDRLAQAISRLHSGNPDGLNGRYPSEIAPLVDNLNAYITHNKRIVDRGRVEAGNLAHALRTPLAVIVDEAEQLAKRPETGAAAAILLNQSQMMIQQIDFRLARVRSAAGNEAPGSNCRIIDVLPQIISAMQRLHPDIDFRLTTTIANDQTLPIDAVDLMELLSILLDNAGKWATRNVRISVSHEAIHIADDGKGMTSQQISKAFAIGTRFDESRPGSGLGLAIARDIADAYGLDLRITPSDAEMGGLGVTIAAIPCAAR